MNFQELLSDKKKLMMIVGGLVVVIALILTLVIVGVSKGGDKGGAKTVGSEPLKANVELLSTDNLGKALEIQSLLARHGIVAERQLDGTKSKLILNQKNCSNLSSKCTTGDRDNAIMIIVKSGLMDQNVGLEVFDKGDFTSTKEDKKIRYARAVNGELARLIKKLDKVQNATVFVSIPETKMFAAEQKAPTAAVQVTVSSKLDRSDIKAITNLLMGSVQGLEQDNITISDTEGNVYASLAASDDQLAKIEENDNYMKSKVQVQLDKLIGKGNYAVSVSTFLTQSPTERTTIGYDPKTKTAISEQSFSEGLGDQTRDASSGVNAVSVYLPNGLPATSNNSAQNRSYSRSAKEVQYGISKVQQSEYIKKGVIEDISIAVTLDEQYMPQNITLEELKGLIARAASPKVNPDNVTIAFSDSLSPRLQKEKGTAPAVAAKNGNPWWISIVLIVVGLLVGLKLLSSKISGEQRKNQKELEELRDKASQQEKQLNDINQKASELIEQQSQLAQNLLEQQNQLQIAQQPMVNIPNPADNTETGEEIPVEDDESIDDTLSEISSGISDADEDETLSKVMSWIEKS